MKKSTRVVGVVRETEIHSSFSGYTNFLLKLFLNWQDQYQEIQGKMSQISIWQSICVILYTRVVWKVSDLAYNRRETRDKGLLGRDPDRSRCHLHTSLKLFLVAARGSMEICGSIRLWSAVCWGLLQSQSRLEHGQRTLKHREIPSLYAIEKFSTREKSVSLPER